tara:strand:- start:55 stop:816 length:762 start_codon:yes stop_codon:yes gene_type:complete
MGALHAGHVSLINQSLESCERTAVSIYVNPKQFGPDEDLQSYPCNIEEDLDILRKLRVDAVFLPSDEMMYPDGFSTHINETSISKTLEGVSRPQFFCGVLTIVLKLFNILSPGKAFFGMKDYQQLVLVEKMVRELNLNTKIIRCETVREEGGLAMSSRNRYFKKEEIAMLGIIFSALKDAKSQIVSGTTDLDSIKQDFTNRLSSVDDLSLDYLKIVDMECKYLDKAVVPCAILVALYHNRVRLIDNIIVDDYR